MKPLRLVIENLEDELSDWLFLEYSHAARIWGGALFTNVASSEMAGKLRNLGAVTEKPCHELLPQEKTLILDPRGEKPLTRKDLLQVEAVVIGGILGEAKPKGRTFEMISSRMKGARVRNLGEVQLTIDTAALVVKLVEMGMALDEIEVTSEVEIRVSEEMSINLPYGYVLLEGKLILTPGLKDYFLREYR